MLEHNNEGCITNEAGTYHEYATKRCSRCETRFCFTCCGRTNVHEGGKHTPDFMLCPICQTDFYYPLKTW